MKNGKYLSLILASSMALPLQSQAVPVYSGCYFSDITYTEVCPIVTEVFNYDITGTADFYYDKTDFNIPGELANSYNAVGSFQYTTVSNTDTGFFSASGILNLQPGADTGFSANYSAEFSDPGTGQIMLLSESFSGDFSLPIVMPTIWEIFATADGVSLNTLPNPDYFFRDGVVTGTDIFNNSYVIDISVTGTISAVPVPASIWLLGSGFLGLIGVKLRKKQA